MANYHILRQSDLKHEVDIVFHIPVPVQTNLAGKYLSDCLKEDLAPSQSAVPWLQANNPTEYASILDGQIFEKRQIIAFNANLSVAEKRALLDAEFNTLLVIIPDKIINIYQWWGTDQDVA